MNYNTLMNKPTINYRELIGDNTVTEVGGITEEEFNDLLDTDLASYYTKAQIDALFARSFVFRDKSGGIVNFDCPESTNGIAQLLSDIVAVQSGSGDPSSTNVRPFSGWSAVNVYDTGKNLFNPSSLTEGKTINSDGSIDDQANRSATVEGMPIQPNSRYTISYVESIRHGVFYYDKYDNFISFLAWGNNPRAFLTPSNAYYVRFSFEDGTAPTNVMLSIGKTPTTYTAYNGQTYTTALKDGQGDPLTCYGGGLMNTGGSQALLVTKGHIASYNGETLPSTWESDRDVYVEGTTPTIGAEVVYELETPLQIPQDSLSIVSIGGINNIWCDSGDITVRALDKIIQE